MNDLRLRALIVAAGCLALQFFAAHPAAAAISNGEPAMDEIGQYDANNSSTLTPIYTKGAANNVPNQFGLSSPRHISLDSANHRLFLADFNNNRVLVYALNSDNTIGSKVPAYVLGQPDFNTNTAATNQAGMSGPYGFAYDSTNSHLFVSDVSNCRVLEFDLSGGISNGMKATHVLGQPNFTSNGFLVTQAGMNDPLGLAYDAGSTRLFVADSNNRVLVYDLSGGIADGMNAFKVLGQSDFVSGGAATTQTGLSSPGGVIYASATQRLFVTDAGSNRVLIYDLSNGVSNGMNAAYVLGQANFTSGGAATTQTGMRLPAGVAYDSADARLFISELSSSANRVLVFDLSATTTSGMNAVYVLGQPDFTTGTVSRSTTFRPPRPPA